MRLAALGLLALFLGGCASSAEKSSPAIAQLPRYEGLNACSLVYDQTNKKWIEVYNEERCKERFPACSTFKVPLAVMGFDSGVLKDQSTSYKWDQVKHPIESWNRDHTAASWMSDSVVWYSQRLTEKLGRRNIQTYLDKFNYGNADFTGALTSAWLTPAPFLKEPPPPTVMISVYEQIDFMRRLWTNQLPVSPQALEKTKSITFLETTPKGFKLYGKTGSGFLNPELTKRVGWFIAHLERGNESYLAVMTYDDRIPQKPGTYGGAFAKATLIDVLKDKGLY